jgi:flavin-dependent dehydrogenase
MVSETAILGGGLAGGAAALQLARSGAPVRLFEREAEPREKICGEFLSIEAQRDLARLGIDTDRLGAMTIDRVRLSAGSRQVEAPLPFTAQGISRKILDASLLEAASAAGAKIERGVRVSGLDGCEISTSAGPCRADRILLATGKHDVRGVHRADPATRDGYVGFKMHYRPTARQGVELSRTIELVLFAGGYAGLQLVAPRVLNLCLIVRRDRLGEAGGRWEALIAELMREPALTRRLDGAEPLFAQPLTIANLPYGFVAAPDRNAPYLYRLGDQAAMTASLTGDGMAVALRSGALAAASILAGADSAAYQARLRSMVSGQVRRAMLVQGATETPWMLQAGIGLLALWPRLLAALASATRLPERSFA